MKKGSAKPKQIKVAYKGTTFILQPGHKVFECNLVTGLVKEHPIHKTLESKILFWTEPVYTVTYRENIVHKPAFDIHKAMIDFKDMTSEIRKKDKMFRVHTDRSKIQ